MNQPEAARMATTASPTSAKTALWARTRFGMLLLSSPNLTRCLAAGSLPASKLDGGHARDLERRLLPYRRAHARTGTAPQPAGVGAPGPCLPLRRRAGGRQDAGRQAAPHRAAAGGTAGAASRLLGGRPPRQPEDRRGPPPARPSAGAPPAVAPGVPLPEAGDGDLPGGADQQRGPACRPHPGDPPEDAGGAAPRPGDRADHAHGVPLLGRV